MPATATDLRSRLGELTLRDAHRLKRRLDRVRRHPDPKALRKLEADVERAEARVAKRRAAVPAVSYPPELPVSGRREDLLEAIRDNQVVVVAGETGSGKTTQIPKLCLELGRGVRGAIAHTQPRRLAARTVAERIAEELKVPLGGAVGFAVRFSDRCSEDTLVRLMTDGLLLAEIHHDPLLRRYDTVIVDEAHERSLNIDFLLGYLARILPKRPDLKVIITSATIDPERFAPPLRRRAGRRGVGPHLPRRGPLRARRGGRGRRRRDRRRRARRCCASAAATCSCSSPASARSATPRRRCAAGCRTRSSCCRSTRGCRPREQQRVFKPHAKQPRRARHQRRRDVADRARHPLGRRSRAPRGSAATARG